MKKDEAPGSGPVIAANDNDVASDPVAIDAALTRIAEALGRHIAREHIKARKAANDNEPGGKNPKPPKH
ncbi:hypothetical protein [Sphingopyxis kveilinensis]|uniref:hypothetical protein n=1 Tax=Sphingopyxis kveilinensis TaxID=3114367 RepID=UPI0030D2B174